MKMLTTEKIVVIVSSFIFCLCLFMCGCTKSDKDIKNSIESSEIVEENTEDDIEDDIDSYYGFGDESNACNIFTYNEQYGRYDGKILKHSSYTSAAIYDGNKSKILDVLINATGDKVLTIDVQESELSQEMYSFTFGYTNAEKSEYNQLLLTGNYAINSRGEIYHIDGKRLLKNLNVKEHIESCSCGYSGPSYSSSIIPNLRYICTYNDEWVSSELLQESYYKIINKEEQKYVEYNSGDGEVLVHPLINTTKPNVICDDGTEKLYFTLRSDDYYDNYVSPYCTGIDVCIDDKWYEVPEFNELTIGEKRFTFLGDEKIDSTTGEIKIRTNESHSYVWDYGKWCKNLPKGKYRMNIRLRRIDTGAGGSYACIIQEFEVR